MLYEEITKRVIAASMEVHNRLGNGFQEVIYQRALALELSHIEMEFEREKEIPIYYRDEFIGTRRADFFIDNKIMVEIKSVMNLDDSHLAQAINYLEAYKMEVGLLINFGNKSLQFKRVHNNKLIKQ